ncbi:MAG: hypothetical protein J3K34DRAFT_444440 [Monoraphidium minutum]|nr:MAG: hypothetical protein J3K34DRAFT_444440 [Monoraphidium minutum]
MKAHAMCALLVLSAAALAVAQPPGGGPPGGGPPGEGPPGAGGPPGADTPPAPPCECPFPENGGGYYGRGQLFVASGCKCENACEFRPSPSGPKPSCATVCTCGDNVKLQTFNNNRGPLVIPPSYGRGYPFFFSSPLGRKLMGSGEHVFVERD